MKQKAFTLVELLAVLVILAIIALITTSIVLNMIEKSKINSAEISFKNVERAAKLYYVENGRNKNTEFICKDEVCKSGETILALDGQAPSDGIINIDEQGNITFTSMIISGYYCHIEDNNYKCEAVKKVKNEIEDGLITLDNPKTEILTNYRIYGNSYQETRSGKNLFDCKSFVNNAKELGAGNSISIIEGGIKLSHMDYQEKYSKLNLNLKEKTVYTLSADVNWVSYTNDGVVIGFMIYYDDGTNSKAEIGKNTTKMNFTSLADKTIVAISSRGWQYQGEVNITNIQLEEGTTATEYEPYGVMPSLEYPSDIQSVGDLVTDSNNPNYGKYEIPIKVRGKNLFDVQTRKLSEESLPLLNTTVRNFDFDKFYIGLTSNNYFNPGKVSFYEIKGNSIFVTAKQTGYGVGFPIEVNSNRTYVYSSEKTGVVYIGEYTSNGNWIRDQIINDGVPFTTSSNTKIITIVLRPDSASGLTEYKNIQLEEGTKVTEYEPYYKEKKHTIYLDEPLRCVGDVCDYIDYKNGQVVRKVGIVELDGENNKIFKNDSVSNVYMYYFKHDISHAHVPSLSTHFVHTSSYPSYADKKGKFNSTLWNNDDFWISGYGIVSADNATLTALEGKNQFTNWLKNQKNNGNPVMIQYALFEKKFEKIALPNISIFESATTLDVETSIKPSKIEIEYYK